MDGTPASNSRPRSSGPVRYSAAKGEPHSRKSALLFQPRRSVREGCAAASVGRAPSGRCPSPSAVVGAMRLSSGKPCGRTGGKPCDASATFSRRRQGQQEDCPNGQEFYNKDHCAQSRGAAHLLHRRLGTESPAAGGDGHAFHPDAEPRTARHRRGYLAALVAAGTRSAGSVEWPAEPAQRPQPAQCLINHHARVPDQEMVGAGHDPDGGVVPLLCDVRGAAGR